MNKKMRYCSICGEELEPDEIDICNSCKAILMGINLKQYEFN